MEKLIKSTKIDDGQRKIRYFCKLMIFFTLSLFSALEPNIYIVTIFYNNSLTVKKNVNSLCLFNCDN